jgi:mono/diheme cytochrome c family protein
MKRRWIVVTLAVLAFAAGALEAQQESAMTREDRSAEGRRMFFAQGCYGCHMVTKFGTPIGPDLSHVGAKYSEAALKTWLRDPALHRPTAHMPQLELTEAQIAALASFLKTLE